VESAAPRVGVNVEDARDYEDLSLVPDEFDYWTIQAGSFSFRKAADRRKLEIEQAGFEATIYGQVIGGTGFFVVRTGNYATREAALAAMRDLEEKSGIRAFLVSPGS
jgi:cell division protein FtsN